MTTLTRHNVAQMARGYLMYQLARRGYKVQIADSRFPKVDLLVVSPIGKYFGIDVKGQRIPSFWRFNEREPNSEFYFAFVYVPVEGTPRIFLLNSENAMTMWREYKQKARGKGVSEESIWGLNWTQPHSFEDRYDLLPN